MSIAELWKNRKTTTLRLPNDLALYEALLCVLCALPSEEKKEPGIHCFCACANLRPRKNNEYTQTTLLVVELLCVMYYVLNVTQAGKPGMQ